MITSTRYSKTAYLVLCGLFAAITAICSFITIPLGFTPVPVNLATLAVFLAGGILGKKYGTISISVYVLLGAAGVPVFAGFKGGIGVLAGPTGGYIIGYIAAALVTGIFIDRFMELEIRNGKNADMHNSVRQTALCAVSMIAGLMICYAFGTAWFMISTGTPLWASMLSCVIPFLPGDAVKIFVGAVLVKKIRPLVR